MSSELIQGFTLQASLIFGLGAQNLFLIDCGLKKRCHLLVAFICSLCDCALIILGVAGAGTFFSQNKSLQLAFTILGILFLFYYGAKKFFEKPLLISSELSDQFDRKIIWQSLGFSLLNPHVYLDTVVLIGGFSSQFLQMRQRLLFGVGAGLYSVFWFFGLVLFSAAMKNFLNKPGFLKILNRGAGVLLIYLGVKLLLELLNT